jgi:hypothetical protein
LVETFFTLLKIYKNFRRFFIKFQRSILPSKILHTNFEFKSNGTRRAVVCRDDINVFGACPTRRVVVDQKRDLLSVGRNTQTAEIFDFHLQFGSPAARVLSKNLAAARDEKKEKLKKIKIVVNRNNISFRAIKLFCRRRRRQFDVGGDLPAFRTEFPDADEMPLFGFAVSGDGFVFAVCVSEIRD